MKTKWNLPHWWMMMAEEEGGGGEGAASGGEGAAGEGGEAGGEGAGGEGAASGGDGAASAEGYWPADWREQITGGDESLAKRAGRYATPKEAFDALVAAQNRIRSGELKSALPEKPTDEELQAWREENGIPKAPEDYDLKIDGLVIGDQDKPIVDQFLKVAHGQNLKPEQVKPMVEWWYQSQQEQLDQRAEQDWTEREQAMDKLNQEWGPEYRRNVNMISGLFDQFPESVRDGMKSARLPDGTALMNHPDVLKGFANLALEINPAGTVVPSGSGDPAKSIQAEIKEIETMMRTNRAAYNKDEKVQARYRELLEAQQKLQARAS